MWELDIKDSQQSCVGHSVVGDKYAQQLVMLLDIFIYYVFISVAIMLYFVK